MPVKLPSLGGGGGSSSSLLLDGINFPLTISKTQPTAIRAGHIWVDSDRDSKITKVKILETLNTGEENGTLMLVVGDLSNHSLSFSNPLKTTNGSSKTVSVSNTTSTAATWSIMSETCDASSSLKVNNPMVYSKVDNVFDIENAYMWNGSSWIQLSKTGSYLAYIDSASTVKIQNYNSSTNELTNNTSFTISSYTLKNIKFTRNGMYFIIDDKVYKRSGDTFTLYYTVPYNAGGNYVTAKNSSLSEDGMTLVSPYQSGSNVGFVVMQNNGSAFVVKQSVNIGGAVSANSEVNVCVSANGKNVLLSYPISGTYTGTGIDLFMSSNGVFPSTGIRLNSFTGSSSSYVATMLSCPYNDSLFAYEAHDSYGDTTDSCVSVNISNNSYTRTVVSSGSRNNYTVIGWIDNILIYSSFSYDTNKYTYIGKDIITNTTYTIVLDGFTNMTGLVMHNNGNKATCWNAIREGYILQVTKSGTTITLKSLKSYYPYNYGAASII